jgi:hypothetical protein
MELFRAVTKVLPGPSSSKVPIPRTRLEGRRGAGTGVDARSFTEADRKIPRRGGSHAAAAGRSKARASWRTEARGP